MTTAKQDDYAAMIKFLRGKGCDQPEGRNAAAAIESLQAKLASAEAESLEQARLLGMSAEKELALHAKLQAAERDAERLDYLVRREYRIVERFGQFSLFDSQGERAGSEYDTARAAIDAAIAQESNP